MSSEWVGVPDDIAPYQGFVYQITCLKNGRKYIGKKFFWKALRRKPLKGKKRVRIDRVESDWRSYWGSCRVLLEDVERYGKESFKREILGCYESKFMCAYEEAKKQFDVGVLFSDIYYNEIINIRLRRVNSNKFKE